MLRELDFQDAPALLDLLRQEAEGGRFMGNVDGLDLEAVNNFILAALICQGDEYRAVCSGQGEFAGLVGLKAIDREQGRAEFCIALLPQARGRGLGRQAARELLSWAFANLRLERVYMFTRRDNRATRSFNRRMGFRPQAAEFELGRDYCWYGGYREQFAE